MNSAYFGLNCPRRRVLDRCAALSVALALLAVACTTSPLGRKQLMIVDDATMNQMGAQAFQQIKTETPVDADPANRPKKL